MSDKWKCDICEGEYNHEGGVENKISDSGKNVCEYCMDKVVAYSVTKTTLSGSRFYGSAECQGDEVGTAWFATRKEAKDHIFEMINKLWPDAEKVED